MARRPLPWYDQLVVRYSKDMEWVRPYVEDAARRKLFSPMKVVRVSGYRLKPHLEEWQDAGITKVNGKCTISIRTWSRKHVKGKWVQSRIYFYDALDALSHELAHTAEWEHTPRHTELQMAIMASFVKTAKRLGVKDMWSRIPRA